MCHSQTLLSPPNLNAFSFYLVHHSSPLTHSSTRLPPKLHSPFIPIQFPNSTYYSMASSLDNLDFLEPWSAFWFSDAEPLFLADHALPHSVPSSIPDTPRSVQSVTVSVSGSDPDTDSSRKRSSPSGPVNGRVSKRKPRPSKKSTTTYITADASNFQEMVQQATGVNFSSMSPVLKPQTKRIGAASTSGCGPLHYCLPTLDTSAFLLDHHYQQVAGHSGAVDAHSGAGKTCTPPDFDKLACFPTLDSWKVM